MDQSRVFESVVKFSTIAVVGAGLTWWATRCAKSVLREVKDVAGEVKDTIAIVRTMLMLPHMTKMIDFASTVPEDRTFAWEGVFTMARDHRAIIESLRDIVNANNLTSAISIADRAIPSPSTISSMSMRRNGGESLPPAQPSPPANPEVVLEQIRQIKGISDSLHDIVISDSVSKLVDTVHSLQNPHHISKILQSVVFAALILLFSIWLAWVSSGSATGTV